MSQKSNPSKAPNNILAYAFLSQILLRNRQFIFIHLYHSWCIYVNI